MDMKKKYGNNLIELLRRIKIFEQRQQYFKFF